MFCKNCGENNPDGSVYCISCGQPMNEQVNPPPVSLQPQYPLSNGAPPPVPIPNKHRKKGMIVLIISLSVVAAAAVILLCIKLYASPSTPPAEFSGAYQDLLDSESISADSTALEPANTPITTSAATEAPTPQPTEETIDLPFDFTQIDYPVVTHVPAVLDSITQFETILVSYSWVYSASHGHPNAVSIDDGFLDIKSSEEGILRVYQFNKDLTVDVVELDADDQSPLSIESDTYWTQTIQNTYVVCVDVGVRTVFEENAYDVIVIMYVDEDANLVETVGLYDAHSDNVIFISNSNIYTPQEPAGDDENTRYSPMDWSSQEEFEDVLYSYIWSYTNTVDKDLEFTIPELHDITPNADNKIIFYDDGSVYGVTSNPETTEIISEETLDYDIRGYTANIYIADFELDGLLYEITAQYYIDQKGYLIASIKLYNSDEDEYYNISNANVFEPISP